MITWRSTVVAVAICASFTATAHAQALPIDRVTPPLPTATGRTIADVASWGAALAAIAIDTTHCWQDADRRRACTREGIRLGVTNAAVYAIKTLVHRDRPCAPVCGIDNPHASFPSAHAANVWSTIGGGREGVLVPLAIGVDAGRIFADKHFLTDVVIGSLIGAATSRIR